MSADSSATPGQPAANQVTRPPLQLPTDRTQAGTTDLARGLVDDAQKLLELQMELARAELRGLAIRNGIAVGLIAFAALLLTFAIFAGIPLIVVVLVPNHGLAAIIFAAAYAVAAIILAVAGRLTLKLEPPPRTIAALKETKEWLVRQISTSR